MIVVVVVVVLGPPHPPHLSQQQKKEHGEVSRPLNFPEFGESVHSAMKACRSVMWIGSWVWCCGNQRLYFIVIFYSTFLPCSTALTPFWQLETQNLV